MQTDIFTTLYNRTKNDVKHYQDDFKIDKKTIDKNPGKKFVHITREHGTALILFSSLDQYPNKGERIPYLFGTTNREELIKGNLITIKHYINNNPISVNYFDGRTLKKIKPEAAEQIYTNHLNSIVNSWEEEHRNQQRRDAEAKRQRDEFFKDQAKRKTSYNRAQMLEEQFGRAAY